MPLDTAYRLLDRVRTSGILSPSQLDECARDLAAQFPEPRAFAGELIQRGWLTPYQVNRLFQDKADELILGPYLLLERLGEGGMGAVFKARHKLMDRVVALKVIRAERLTGADDARRFLREIQAAARLSHPNIVLAYDADRIGDRFFFVMEYVEGADLSKLVRQQGPLPPAAACDYARRAALGLQHAHEQGLVHRDIKPANLLLTTKGGVVKVLDLGLARLSHGENSHSTEPLTHYGTVMGTLDFMAPEQAIDPHGADIRADIYSLGCTLYVLLTGKVPFPGGSFMEKLFRHKEIEPLPVEAHRPEVPLGLALVVRKMMAKPREARYQTPAEAAAALLPYCGGGAAPRMRTAEEENSQGGEASLSFNLVVDSMATTAGESGVGSAEANRQQQTEALPMAVPAAPAAIPMAAVRRRSLPRWKWALVVAAVLCCLFGLAIVLRGRKDTTAQEPAKPEEDARETLPGGIAPQPLDWKEGEPLSPLALVSRPPMLDGVRGWTIETRDCRSWVYCLEWSPDGKYLALAGLDGTIRLVDAANGQLLRAFVGHGGGVLTLNWSRDGRLLASGSGDGTLRLWDAKSGRMLRTLRGHSGGVDTVAWSPDGKELASGGQDGLRLWDIPEGQPRMIFRGGKPPPPYNGDGKRVAWSPDGKTLACGADKFVQLWDVASGELKRSLAAEGGVWALAWSPDGKQLVAGAWLFKGLQRWDVSSGKKLPTVKDPAAWHNRIAWSPDGKILASATQGGFIQLWDAKTNEPLPQLLHNGQAHLLSLAWSPDSKRLASSCIAGSVRVWDVAAGKSAYTLNAEFYFSNRTEVAWSPDGKTLATCCGPAVRLWDAATGEPISLLTEHTIELRDATWSPNGRWLASTGLDAAVKLWNCSIGRWVRTLPLARDSGVWHHAWSADSALLATAGTDGAVLVWEAATGRPRARLLILGPYTALAVGADGHFRGTPRIDKDLVYIVQTEQGQEMLTPEEFAHKYNWTNDPQRVHLLDK
ncbi:MAG TPA: protein kinase [Gemmataceae bacterium]|jgi:WD40 repeat protein/tRNA A-37 threonylcarbamoyl transferase component Bud32